MTREEWYTRYRAYRKAEALRMQYIYHKRSQGPREVTRRDIGRVLYEAGMADDHHADTHERRQLLQLVSRVYSAGKYHRKDSYTWLTACWWPPGHSKAQFPGGERPSHVSTWEVPRDWYWLLGCRWGSPPVTIQASRHIKYYVENWKKWKAIQFAPAMAVEPPDLSPAMGGKRRAC